MAVPDLSDLAKQAARRRTFAIISHPDAGKTTLTENLLLAGGAIRLAGEVRARGETRRTRSDWMKIERERGISVSASVMTFERDGVVFNLLDTPGHEDFSEDTYRTLTAADSAVMVLDAAKGIEPQTLKLFEVCRLRDIPIITFINKMDREAQDPFALLDEVHEKLALDVAPVFWPAGSGNRFRGMLDLRDDRFHVFRRPEAGEKVTHETELVPMASNHITETMSAEELEELRETADLARAGLPAFEMESYREGHMTPVFFGSALRKFGVTELLDGLAQYAPPPRAQKAALKSEREPSGSQTGDASLKARAPTMIEPARAEVSGFVFKIQANMDPRHRDRVAMMRVCSGRFRRGMTLKTATGKALNVHAPLMFMAQDREILDEAFPGDVIGVPNHGALRVGDSLSESGQIVYAGIPNFAPEILKRCRVADPLKQKHLRKALEGMAEEGVTQLFKPMLGSELIIGAVGALQFDVLEERLRAENGLDVLFEQSPYQAARWISADARADLDAFMDRNKSQSAEDLDGAPVFLGKTAWEIGYVQEKNPKVRFTGTKQRG